MRISMIAAMANDRVIGANNTMPWHLPADLKHFKQTTLGKPIIMGRKTYESIGKALPGRLNLVVTSNPNFSLDDATVVSSCEHAIEVAKAHCTETQAIGHAEMSEVMIIGGGTVYQHFLPFCGRLYLTQIDLSVKGDTYFPDYQAQCDWQEIESEAYQPDEKNPYNYRFITLEKLAV